MADEIHSDERSFKERVKDSVRSRTQYLETSAVASYLKRDISGAPIIFMGMHVLEGTAKILKSKDQPQNRDVRIFFARDIDWDLTVNESDSWLIDRLAESDKTPTSLDKLVAQVFSMINKNRPSISSAQGLTLIKEIIETLDRLNTSTEKQQPLTIIISHGDSDPSGEMYLYGGGTLDACLASHFLREYKEEFFSEVAKDQLPPVVIAACSGEFTNFESSGFPIVYSESGETGTMHSPIIKFKR